MSEKISDLKREVSILKDEIKKKDKEIEKLKKENLLLLRVSLKRAEEHEKISDALRKKLKLDK